MGFLRRLLGGSDHAEQGMTLNVNYFTQIRDDAALEVVGEAYRQNLITMARSPSATDLPPGMPPPPAGYYKAVLVPEPTNQYDPNAVRVLLWAGRTWALAGYLSRTDAAAYQPVFRWLAAHRTSSAPAIACDAAIKSERGGAGVVLHLGTPGECMVELVTDDLPQRAHQWTGKRIVFTGDSATTIYGASLDRPAQLMLARWAGCDVLPRLTKKTELLVVAASYNPTSNLQNAKDYGVPIVEEPAFLHEIGIPVELVGRASTRWASGSNMRR
jgi:hypothetical protein